MAEQKNTKRAPMAVQIAGGLIAIIIIAVIAINIANNKNNSQKMSIQEAQAKCMLMEEADMVNTMGEPFGDATTEKAREFCLSQWNRTDSPENTDEKFIDIVQSDWEERKNEILEGYTLQQLYNQSN